MFNVGGGELLVILLVALIVLGPTKLPEAARQFGRVMNELRRISSGFQREMREALDDPIEAAARDRGRKATQSTAAAAGMYPKGDPDGPNPDETADEDEASDTDEAPPKGSGDGDGAEAPEASDDGHDRAEPVRRTTDLPTTTVFRPRTAEPPDEVEAAGG